MSLYSQMFTSVMAQSATPMAAASKEQVKLSAAEDFALAGIAAVVSKTASAPIERVKMVVQNQGEMIKQGTLKQPFNGIVDCTKWIAKEEGFGAFWKSNGTNCIRYFPTQALNIMFKNQIKTIPALKKSKGDSYGLQLSKNIFAGGAAGWGSSCFVYHLDYARTRLANDLKGGKDGKREYSGLIDVYKKTLSTDGIAGLYRGFAISSVGIFVYRGLYFGLYDTVMPNVPEFESGAVTGAIRFSVAYAVTVIAGLASYPIDTIRRRMMMTSGQAVKYNGSIDCGIQIVKGEGFMALMKGAGANILRGVAGAGVLFGFDTIKDAYVAYKVGA